MQESQISGLTSYARQYRPPAEAGVSTLRLVDIGAIYLNRRYTRHSMLASCLCFTQRREDAKNVSRAVNGRYLSRLDLAIWKEKCDW